MNDQAAAVTAAAAIADQSYAVGMASEMNWKTRGRRGWTA